VLVDDEAAMLRALRINLRVREYDVATAATGQEALTEAGHRPPDAVILDLGLPDLDGIEVIRRLRGWSSAPIIVLSGRAGPGDKIAALDAGADDYVTKPFSMEELLARLRAALRRDAAAVPDRARIGACEVDLAAHTVRDGTRAVRLTPIQWRLLEILLRHPGDQPPLTAGPVRGSARTPAGAGRAPGRRRRPRSAARSCAWPARARRTAAGGHRLAGR
jgi:two-component system, OmpR family, KDP operon response regulator KdpE